MKLINAAIAALLTFLISGNAYALGAVSRACQFSTLPSAVKAPAVLFFQAVGAPLSVLQLPGMSDQKQKEYWINESVTTDYIKVRYYLFAIANVYGYVHDPLSTYYGMWQYATGYASPKWTAEEISQDMQLDARFNIYYRNRGPFYSARAGHSEIVIAQNMVRWGRFVVLGTHNYYDPVVKVSGTLRGTKAADCNLGEWGADKGMFDR